MNQMKEAGVTVLSSEAGAESVGVREMTFYRAESLMMSGIIGEIGEYPSMDKGDRRKKKIEKQKGERPEKGKGSKGSSKAQLDLVIFDSESVELQPRLDEGILYQSPTSELTAGDVVMKKHEQKKSQRKASKTAEKRKQAQKIQKQG